MIIKTADIQKYISILMSGIVNDENILKRSMLGVKTTSNDISFIAIGNNKVKVTLPIANSETIDVAIDGRKFLALISKITTETFELTYDSSSTNIIIKTNGKYIIPKYVSENGDIKIPDITLSNPVNIGVLTSEYLKNIRSNNSNSIHKQSLGLQTEFFHLYPECAITTDTEILAKTNLTSGVSRELILNTNDFNQISLLRDNIEVKSDSENLIFSSDNATIVINNISDSSVFPKEALLEQINDTSLNSEVEISKKDLLSTIDRLSIFNITNENYVLSFTPSKLIVKCYNQDEELLYNSSNNVSDYEFSITIDKLKRAISSVDSDLVKIKYKSNVPDNEKVLKLIGKSFEEIIS